MLKYDFENSVGFWLTTCYQAYMRALQEELTPQGITYRQAQVLAWLSMEGPLSQAELAARMSIEPPSLVGTLDRMELCKFIERRPCPTDRRKKLVHPCESSEAMWEKVVNVARTVRARATAGLSDEDRIQLKRLLQKISDNVSTAHDRNT